MPLSFVGSLSRSDVFRRGLQLLYATDNFFRELAMLFAIAYCSSCFDVYLKSRDLALHAFVEQSFHFHSFLHRLGIKLRFTVTNESNFCATGSPGSFQCIVRWLLKATFRTGLPCPCARPVFFQMSRLSVTLFTYAFR